MQVDQNQNNLNVEVSESVKVDVSEDASTSANIVTEDQDRHEVSPVTKEAKLTKNTEDMLNNLVLPAGVQIKLVDYTDRISEFIETKSKTKTGKKKNVISDEDMSVIEDHANSIDLAAPNNAYSTVVNENINSFVNSIKFGDKNLNNSSVRLASAADGRLSGDALMFKLQEHLYVGELIQCPLWHSGFWVTIKPPSQRDIINLETALTNSEIVLGRDTGGLIYGNYNVVFNRIVTNFIVDHIVDQSLILTSDMDIRDYIVINDLYPLVLGMISSMHPNGITSTQYCTNTLEPDPDNIEMARCNQRITAVFDPKKMLWLDRKSLSNKMLTHMSKRQRNSVNHIEVTEYQKSITKLNDTSITLKSESGKEVKLEIGLPMLSRYITQGERWVNDIVSSAEKLFKEADTPKMKNEKIIEMACTSTMGIYSSYIKSITFVSDNGEEARTDNEDDIYNTLSVISQDSEMYVQYLESIQEYLNKSAISLVAIPNYTCPTCNKLQPIHNDKSSVFSELIPINALQHFFVLCVLRVYKTRTRAVL